MIKSNTHNRGLVKMVILIVVALLVISYFGLNLRNIVNSPTFQDNWSYLKGIIIFVWNNYLSGIASFIWNSIIMPLLKKVTGQGSV